MFITPAYAQSADGGLLGQMSFLFPLVLIFVIMYFLVLRPQRAQMKKQQEMIKATRRGDTVVTAGGLIGKVTKVFDDSGELEVEIAENVRVRLVRSTLSTVRSKGEGVGDSQNLSEKPARKKPARKPRVTKDAKEMPAASKTTEESKAND